MEIISFIFSVVSLVISSIIAIRGWWKQRNVYDIELNELFSSEQNKFRNQEISRKLNSGKYTILHTEKTGSRDILDGSPTYHIILGKIKN